jgi:hypothetical protein
MSGFGAELAGFRSSVRELVTSTGLRLRQTTPGPALIRLTAGLAALGTFALALPDGAPLPVLALLFSAAVGLALFPRTRWVTMTIFVAVGLWLFTMLVQEHEASLTRLTLFAAALYVTHASAALAAVVPYDCVVSPRVLLRWLGRVGVVLAASLAVAMGGLAIADQLPGTRTAIGPIVGSLVAAGLAGLLAWHLRRR